MYLSKRYNCRSLCNWPHTAPDSRTTTIATKQPWQMMLSYSTTGADSSLANAVSVIGMLKANEQNRLRYYDDSHRASWAPVPAKEVQPAYCSCAAADCRSSLQSLMLPESLRLGNLRRLPDCTQHECDFAAAAA